MSVKDYMYVYGAIKNKGGGGGSVETDKTLTKENVPADAKAVGTALQGKVNSSDFGTNMSNIYSQLGSLGGSIGAINGNINRLDGVKADKSEAYPILYGTQASLKELWEMNDGNTYYSVDTTFIGNQLNVTEDMDGATIHKLGGYTDYSGSTMRCTRCNAFGIIDNTGFNRYEISNGITGIDYYGDYFNEEYNNHIDLVKKEYNVNSRALVIGSYGDDWGWGDVGGVDDHVYASWAIYAQDAPDNDTVPHVRIDGFTTVSVNEFKKLAKDKTVTVEFGMINIHDTSCSSPNDVKSVHKGKTIVCVLPENDWRTYDISSDSDWGDLDKLTFSFGSAILFYDDSNITNITLSYGYQRQATLVKDMKEIQSHVLSDWKFHLTVPDNSTIVNLPSDFEELMFVSYQGGDYDISYESTPTGVLNVPKILLDRLGAHYRQFSVGSCNINIDANANKMQNKSSSYRTDIYYRTKLSN